MEATAEENASRVHTWKHIHRVSEIINHCITLLLKRAHSHDQTKLESPEIEGFAQCTHKLADSTYNSEEFNNNKKTTLAAALAHHYSRNRHHPEHFKHGVDEMNLLDLLEMFCDWKASSENQKDGNIRKSIVENANRFALSPQLVLILENTADYLDGV